MTDFPNYPYTEPLIFDSHAHYYDDRFYGEENPQGAEKLLEELDYV